MIGLHKVPPWSGGSEVLDSPDARNARRTHAFCQLLMCSAKKWSMRGVDIAH